MKLCNTRVGYDTTLAIRKLITLPIHECKDIPRSMSSHELRGLFFLVGFVRLANMPQYAFAHLLPLLWLATNEAEKCKKSPLTNGVLIDEESK